MKNRNVEKLEAITQSTLVVEVDIAKQTQWARFVDYRGLETGKTLNSTTIKTALKVFCRHGQAWGRFFRLHYLSHGNAGKRTVRDH